MGRPKRLHKRTSVKGTKFSAGRGQTIAHYIKPAHRRYLDKDGVTTHDKYLGIDIYKKSWVSTATGKTKCGLTAFRGEQSRPFAHYIFSNPAQRNNFEVKIKSNEKERHDSKIKRRTAKKEWKNTFKVGDILYTSWGYDQTNIEFWQVVEVSGRATTVREIAQDKTQEGFMSGNTIPVKNNFIGKPLRKLAQPSGGRDGGGYLKISSCQHAWAWDGKSKYWSSYA